MGERLTRERLGKAGESHFVNLCDRASLTCNPSVRDETGWDFKIEFPLPPPTHSGVTLDQRAPGVCLVQLKTTAAAPGHVALKLSAVERLAKDVRPALIVVFESTPKGEILGGRLIHLLDAPLADVLRALRQAHSEGRFDIQRRRIRFDYRRIGTPFEASPEGLHDVLSQACGPDPGDYVRNKQAQLEQLGFGEDRYQVEALFRIEDLEHLNDITLGILPLKPEQFSVFESRFGIRIPLEDPRFADIEHILIQPASMGSCQIVIRGPALSLPATFTAQAVVGAPIIEEDGPHLLLKNPDIEMRLRGYRLDLQTVGEFHRVNRTLERWIQLVRALGYLTGGRGSLTIRNLAQLSDWILPLTQAGDGPDVHLPHLATVLGGWQELLERAGVSSTAEFNLEAIWEARTVITAVDVLLHSAHSSSFEFSNQPALADFPLPIHALYYNRASLGDASVCFAARVSIHRTPDPTYPYRSSTAEMLDVRPDTDDLDAYAEEQATEHALRVIIDPANIDWVGRFHEE